MKQRFNILLLGVALTLGLFIFYLEKSAVTFPGGASKETTLLALSKNTILSCEIETLKNQFHLVRNKDSWRITDPFDAKASEDFMNQVLSVFEDFVVPQVISNDVSKDQLEDYGLAMPLLRYIIHTAKKDHILLIGRKVSLEDIYYAKFEDDRRIAILPKEWVQNLFQEVGGYQERRLFPFQLDLMDELTVTRDRELFRLKRKDQTWWIEEPFQSKANQSEVLSLLKKLAVLDFSPHIRFEKASFEEPLLDVRYRYGAKEGHWVLGVLEPQKNAYPLKVEHSSQIQALPLSTYTSFNWDPWHYRDKTVFSHNSKDLSQIDVFYGETFQYRALKSEEVWRISNDKTVFHPVNHYFYLILNILENSMVQKFVTRDAKIFESKPTLRMQVTLQNGDEKIYLYYERSGYWLLHDEEKTVLMKDVAFEYWRRPFEKLVE